MTHIKHWYIVALIAIASCASVPDERRNDNVPMYGQPAIPRTPDQVKADEVFVKSAVAGLGSRERAVKAWTTEAEHFMGRGEFHMAMRRYNQVWLLDQNSFQPYWGFGRVMLGRGASIEALEYFDRAVALCDDDYQKPALLSDAGIANSLRAASLPVGRERQLLFDKANSLFSQGSSLDPAFGTLYYRWAQSLFREAKYQSAWEKVRLARANNYKVPESFVRNLSDKQTEAQ
jgi:tetratricopeptide (TPR) repeat protein